MELLSKLSLSIVCLVAGLLFLLLHFIDVFNVAGATISLSPGNRDSVGIVGVILVALALLVEPLLHRGDASRNGGQISSEVPKPSQSHALISAEKFFFTLDDPAAEGGLPATIRGCRQVDILGRTAVNLLGQYARSFEELAQSGCRVRLLMLDPACEAAQYVYGEDIRVYRANAIVALRKLEVLEQHMGEHLLIHAMTHAPTMSFLSIDKGDSQESHIQISLYFLRSALGRDRPIFRIYPNDRWFRLFKSEFEQVWKSTEKRSVRELLDALSVIDKS